MSNSAALLYPIKSNTILDLVDENDVIVGQASRADIHDQGLRHREVHVWFITPGGNVIFQRRALDKDTFPGLLDATAGGHVEQGQGYLQAALCEAEEETGQKLSAADLVELGKLQKYDRDEVSGRANDVFRMNYGYIFSGDLADLTVEAEAGAGFTAIPLIDIPATAGIIPGLLATDYQGIFAKLADLILASQAESQD